MKKLDVTLLLWTIFHVSNWLIKLESTSQIYKTLKASVMVNQHWLGNCNFTSKVIIKQYTTTEKHPTHSVKIAVADPGFARGADHGERAEREPKRGSGGGAPSGVQGQSPWWGARGAPPWSWKLFVHYYTKKWPKVKDLMWKFAPVFESRRQGQP